MSYKAVICSLLVFVASAIHSRLFGQYEERNFSHYTVKNGLSDNAVQCIEQDDRGYIWIGTEAGLNRFDGNGFQQYHKGTPPLNLFSGNIWRLKRFGSGKLGIIGRGGFQLLNTGNYTFSNFTIADTTPISMYLNYAWDAVQFSDGSYGVTTATGFYVFSNAGKPLRRFDAYTSKDIGNQRILYGRDILRFSEKEYIVYINENRIALYHAGTGIFGEMKDSSSFGYSLAGSPFANNDYWSVHYRLSGDEFIFIRGGRNKIIYFNRRLGKTVESFIQHAITDSVSWESRLTKLNDSTLVLNSGISGFHLLQVNHQTGIIRSSGIKYLKNYKINCLFVDKDGRLWAGTPEGLLKQELQPPAINAMHYQPVSGEKFARGFSAVYRYKDKIYASRFAFRKGLVIIDAATKKLIKEISLGSEVSNWNEIRSIEMYHPDTLWLGTNGGLLWFDTKSERYGKAIDEKKYPWASWFFPVLAPPRADGDAWMCSFLSGRVARYNIPTRTFTLFSPQTTPALPFENVKFIVYDSYGDVWISGHSLARWNNRKQVFDTLIRVYGGVNKFNDDIVTIRADDKGSLWLHNTNNGLLEYKIKEKRFIAYTQREGLPFEDIFGLSPVIGNRMWMSGNSQLSLYDLRTHKAIVYDYRDGLPEHKPTARRIYYDSLDKCLYLCCNEYLVQFPFLPPQATDRSSPLYIEEVSVDREETIYNTEQSIRVPHNRNNLSIRCSVIDFDKSNYQFSWRFTGAEKWNNLDDQRTINLNKLSPGDYTLEIRASGKTGGEKTRLFSFTILPPVWKTGWFISLALFLAGSIAYFLYRRRIRNIRQKAEIDKQLSQTEMKALQAQMNPHFIFNSLNSIREMILNNENKEASHFLSKFAHLIRITLDQSSQPLVSLRYTIDYLLRYMEMEQIRNSLLTYTITADERLDQDEIQIPPMLIQPFIENGLWHGVAAGDKRIHIAVHFTRQDENLICTVEDNGMGINQSRQNKSEGAALHRPYGILNIRNRIKLLNEKYGLHCQVRIQDKKDIAGSRDSGTMVTISLPLEMNEL